MTDRHHESQRQTAEQTAVQSERRAQDQTSIAAVVDQFFAAFTSGPDLSERLDRLANLFLPGAVIVRTLGEEPIVYDVVGFIEPRRELLSGARVLDFREWSVGGNTEIFGDIAQHRTGYAKSWREAGVERTGRGVKLLHLVRTAAGWRISALAWDDERDGLRLSDDLPGPGN